MIPKILHFIWLGNQPCPMKWIDTWKQMHADYDIKIWDEKHIEKLTLKNKKIYDEVENKKRFRFNQKSDILRLEILYQYGGVYIDSDMICLKKIDPLLDDDFFIFQEKKNLLSNSVIGASKHNHIILKMINDMQHHFEINKSIWKSTGPGFVTSFLLERNYVENHGMIFKSNNDDVIVYPYYYINIAQDNSKQILCGKLNFTEYKKNKDLRYLKNGFDIKDENIYAFQIWCGGKKEFYKLEHDFDLKQFKNNFNTYLKYIRS